MEIAGVAAAGLGVLFAIVIVAPCTLQARRWRTRLRSVMTSTSSQGISVVGLLAGGTFAPEGLFTQLRFGSESPHSFVGMRVTDDAVEFWELKRPIGGRPLKFDPTPSRATTIDRGTRGLDFRVDSDRVFPRIWVRWIQQGEMACVGFVPVSADSLFRRPISDREFNDLASSLSRVLPARPN
jgi:hypothetical protein